MVAVNDPIGERSANLILKYSVYLSTIPLLTSLMGITSYMFAFEGTVLNSYLIYLSYKFSEDQSNQNARKVFLTTLWYLPLLLAGFVLHNHNWDKLDNSIRATPVSQRQLVSYCYYNSYSYYLRL
jgi:protoheme IX farnesyltransferase